MTSRHAVSLRLSADRDATLRALAMPDIDTFRYENVWDVDLRLAKTFKISGDAGLTIAAEGFNLLNNDVVLSRARWANQAVFTQAIAGAEPGLGGIEEIIAPRILRLSSSFTF